MKLADQLLAQIEAGKLPPRRATLIVGVSGGVDSMGLLHLLVPLSAKYEWRLVVAHLNHRLRRQADGDERWVEEMAHGLGLPFVSTRVNVRQLAKSKKYTLEEAGRVARYDFFNRLAKRYRAKAIVVAHTADDQVETITMNWLRGASLRGLSGMSEWQGNIWRPLLRVSKADLKQLSKMLHFGYREDKTNRHTVYTRNRIRHQVLPLLKKINPRINETLLRNAENLAGLSELLEDQLKSSRQRVKLRRSRGRVTLRLAPFIALPTYLQNELLLEAVGELQGDRQGYKQVHLAEMRKVVVSKNRYSYKQLPGKLFLIKAYDKISVSRFKPEGL